MKKTLLLIISLLFLFVACEDKEEDTTPPTVTITSAFAGIVSEVVPITVMVNDDSGVEKVELWVDGNFTGITDNSEPFELDWNTVPYQDGTAHVIVIRAYDTSGNTADSVPITLTVDNTGASPSAVTLGASYGDDTVTLLWSQNNDADFLSYSLYESETNDVESGNLIFETEDRNDNTYTTTKPELGINKYYWVVVTDTFGLKTNSDISFIAGGLLSFSIGDFNIDFPLNSEYTYTLIIHSNEGVLLADTLIENESTYNILSEYNSDQITEKISVTLFMYSNNDVVIVTFNSLNTGAAFEMKDPTDSPSYEEFEASVSFANIPDHLSSILSSKNTFRSVGDWGNALFYNDDKFDDLFLRFNYLDNEPEYAWINDFSPNEERLVDLNELSFNSMSKHTISFDYSTNNYQLNILGNNYRFENMGNAYEDSSISSVDVYVPDNYNSFEERRTSIYSSDTNDGRYDQTSYGDIPNSFTKIDADFTFLSSSFENLEIQTNGSYDLFWNVGLFLSEHFFIFLSFGDNSYHVNSSIFSWVLDKYPSISEADMLLVQCTISDYTGINGYDEWIENGGFFLSGFDYRSISKSYDSNTSRSNSFIPDPSGFFPNQDIPNNFPFR